MARFDNGILGGFSGKAGTVVGYNRLGTWIIRATPRKSTKNKEGSVDQKASRSAFTAVQFLLKPVLNFIRVGFNLEGRSRNMTAHNAAKSYNLLHAFTNNEIDFSKVVLSFGTLTGALNPTVEADDMGIHFSWENNSGEGLAYSRDQVMVLAYDHMYTELSGNRKPRAYYLVSGARRKDGRETLEIPSNAKGNTLHTYIAFISDDRERISMSTYVGEIVY